MNPENTKYLLEKYPEIFRQHKLPMTQTAMCWLFECGDGWYGIIDTLCKLIQQYVDDKNESFQRRQKIHTGWLSWIVRRLIEWLHKYAGIYYYYGLGETPIYVEATQVKEKYGGLRFYINGGNDYVDGLITFAERLSYMTCEQCGSTDGVTQTKGWVYTLCRQCLFERDIAQYGGGDD